VSYGDSNHTLCLNVWIWTCNGMYYAQALNSYNTSAKSLCFGILFPYSSQYATRQCFKCKVHLIQDFSPTYCCYFQLLQFPLFGTTPTQDKHHIEWSTLGWLPPGQLLQQIIYYTHQKRAINTLLRCGMTFGNHCAMVLLLKINIIHHKCNVSNQVQCRYTTKI